MKRIWIVLVFVLVVGCQSSAEAIPLRPISLSEVYPGDILQVDKVILVDGSTGARRAIEDRQQITEWISRMKDIELTPDENQEDRTGFMFGISLYEGEEKKLGFIPNLIQGVYYKPNPEFEGYIKALFEKHFKAYEPSD
ncbi:hypothetical protein [Paenibacillus sp. TH7-28]